MPSLKFWKTKSDGRSKTPRDSANEAVVDSSQFGMFILEDKPSDESKVVDVVAVHGLNGHYLKTWECLNAAGEEIVWIRDFLPKQLPSARIMSYGYNSAVQFSKSIAGVGTFAEQLLEDLRSWRLTPEEKERPVIFICHSLGGIVVKQVCNDFLLLLIRRFQSDTYLHRLSLDPTSVSDFRRYSPISAALPFSGHHIEGLI